MSNFGFGFHGSSDDDNDDSDRNNGDNGNGNNNDPFGFGANPFGFLFGAVRAEVFLTCGMALPLLRSKSNRGLRLQRA
jgi:hypothetical protein